MQNTTPPAVGGENPYQVAGPGTGWAQGFGNTNWGEVRKALGMMGGMTKMDPNILNNMQNVSKLAYNMTQGFGQPSLQNYQQASDIYRNMVSGNRAMNAQFLAPEREAIADASRGAAVAISNQAGIPAAVKAQQLAELKRQEAGQTGQLSQNLLKEGTAALGQLGVQGGEIARGSPRSCVGPEKLRPSTTSASRGSTTRRCRSPSGRRTSAGVSMPECRPRR